MRGWLRLAAVLAAALLCCGMAGCAPQATGAFYTLEEAYEAGFLTREDLMSIAYYHQGSEDETFSPIPLCPETLGKETERGIKETHLASIREEFPTADLDDVHILEYYGTYGDCVAVHVRDDYRVIDVLEIPQAEIGGVVFYHLTVPGLMIWRQEA